MGKKAQKSNGNNNVDGTILPQEKLVSLVAEAAECTKKDIRLILEETANVVVDKLKSGHKIVLPGLAVKFEMVERPATKARIGRNPSTGEEVKIPAKPAHEVLKVRPMKKIRDAIAC